MQKSPIWTRFFAMVCAHFARIFQAGIAPCSPTSRRLRLNELLVKARAPREVNPKSLKNLSVKRLNSAIQLIKFMCSLGAGQCWSGATCSEMLECRCETKKTYCFGKWQCQANSRTQAAYRTAGKAAL